MRCRLGCLPALCAAKHEQHCSGMEILWLKGENFQAAEQTGKRPLWKAQVSSSLGVPADTLLWVCLLHNAMLDSRSSQTLPLAAAARTTCLICFWTLGQHYTLTELQHTLCASALNRIKESVFTRCCSYEKSSHFSSLCRPECEPSSFSSITVQRSHQAQPGFLYIVPSACKYGQLLVTLFHSRLVTTEVCAIACEMFMCWLSRNPQVVCKATQLQERYALCRGERQLRHRALGLSLCPALGETLIWENSVELELM